MKPGTGKLSVFHALVLGALVNPPAFAQHAAIVDRPPDPHGSPRPARDARNVPVKTSIYVELGAPKGSKTGDVNPAAVSVRLQEQGGAAVELLQPGQHFTDGVSGWLRPRQDLQGARSLAVYLEPAHPLKLGTKYSVVASAGPTQDEKLPAAAGTWSFTTETDADVHALEFSIDLRSEPIRWHGRFFSGICNVVFCTQVANYGPTFDLMAEARKQHPSAWSLQRDFWLTGTEFRPPGFLAVNLPNIVRERETRRIVAIEPRAGSSLLRVEDVFGHDQYGIPGRRPVGEDYHPGDEVLIADGVHDARTRVVSADNAAGTIIVASVANPPGGWKIAYERPLPTHEDPDAPGLFPPGGCYLRKLNPVGTPCYYWGRLDKEWDLAVGHFGKRVVANFADATGDLARDGRSWTTVKDYVQWHETARAIAGHIIDRYGAKALEFTWSVFNEPDLGPMFWRADWNELQKYYDYTTDAILRAFEDRGYRSEKVFIGGLELGGIFGTNLRLKEFLAHCSPRAQAQGAAPVNAAFADRRLAGKRSRRVESLCREHAGKGSPCDFVSVHSYNRSELMAAKLIRAKELALAIDEEYYKSLWVNSHEACPDWLPPPDEAAVDSYLGNGYFATWCLDVVHRQLAQAARDPRFGFGETILTVWPPPANFTGINAVTRVIHGDDDGDGRGDRTVTVPMPIFHVLGLLSDLGDRYWVLPERMIGGHVVSGFASRDTRGVVRVLLYSHNAQDTQSRSDASFQIAFDLAGPGKEGPVRVTESRFDRDHNSPFRWARVLRDRSASGPRTDAARLAAVTRDLEGNDRDARLRALSALSSLDNPARQSLVPAILRLAGQDKDRDLQAAAKKAIGSFFGPAAYARSEIEKIQKMCECHSSNPMSLSRGPDGRVQLSTDLAGNGCTFLTIEPGQRQDTERR